MKNNEKSISTIMETVDSRKGELVEFMLLSMKDLSSAKEFFQNRWSKRTPTEKMDILLLLNSDDIGIDDIFKLEGTQRVLLAELLMIKLKQEDYLPL